MSWIDRARLDVPEVHRLLAALDRMLEEWAETEPDSPQRRYLWTRVHVAANELQTRVYGGPTLVSRLSYWLRPYDARLDARVWRWRRPGPCRVIDLTATAPHENGRVGA